MKQIILGYLTKHFFTVQAERNDSKSCEILQHLNIVQLVKQHAEPPDTFRKNQIFYSYITVRFWGQQQLLCTFKTYLIIILSSTRLMINIESRKLHLFKEVNPKCKPQKDYFASWPSFRAFVHTIIQAKSLLLYIYIYILQPRANDQPLHFDPNPIIMSSIEQNILPKGFICSLPFRLGLRG